MLASLYLYGQSRRKAKHTLTQSIVHPEYSANLAVLQQVNLSLTWHIEGFCENADLSNNLLRTLQDKTIEDFVFQTYLSIPSAF